jgi:excisionase family DNA binding protein
MNEPASTAEMFMRRNAAKKFGTSPTPSDSTYDPITRDTAKAYPGKLSYTIMELCAATGIGRTSIYEAIWAGKLKARKFGGRTVFLADDVREFLANLPAFTRDDQAA